MAEDVCFTGFGRSSNQLAHNPLLICCKASPLCVFFFYFGSVVLLAVSFIAAQPERMLSLLFFFLPLGVWHTALVTVSILAFAPTQTLDLAAFE